MLRKRESVKILYLVKNMGKVLRLMMLTNVVEKYMIAKRQQHFMLLLLTDHFNIYDLINGIIWPDNASFLFNASLAWQHSLPMG